MDSEIFTLINSQDEKIKLWQDLFSRGGEILAKGSEESICRLRAVLYDSKNQRLECEFTSPTNLKNDEEYLGYFFLGGEKYYFQAKASVLQNKVLIPVPTELYHLQRRQNYRVPIPENFPCSLNITVLNIQPQKINCRLADLSSQGCRVTCQLDSSLLKVGSVLQAVLVINRKEPIAIQGVVRHTKIDDSGKLVLGFGVEFTPLSSALESRLFAITLDIHKQLFRRPT